MVPVERKIGRLAACLLLLATATLLACGGKSRPRGTPETPPIRGGAQEGISSWYGKDFHGRPTASGERFDMHALTAAHRTLPLGTLIRVTNLENGREATLKVNDRGPFVKGRILDCSYGAAKELGFAGAGLARVRIEVLREGQERTRRAPSAGEVLAGGSKTGEPIFDGTFTVQVGAFTVEANAVRLRDTLQSRYGDAYAVRFREFWRVRVGHVPSEDAAEALLERLREDGFGEGFVTRND